MSRLVPEPSAPPTMSALGDPLGQAEKFVVEVFEDTALWESIDESKVPSKAQFGPRAIIYGGWFPTCADWSFVCVYDRGILDRGAMCISDCSVENGVGGRYSSADVEAWIKKPAYYRTDKSYHPNIAETIDQATNVEKAFVDDATANNKPVYAYQREQGTKVEFTDESTEEVIVLQPHLTMVATSWLPNNEFKNEGGSLDGYPMFIGEEPYEIIWSYKDNTQDATTRMDAFYEVKVFGTIEDAAFDSLTRWSGLTSFVSSILFLTLF